MGGVRDHLAAQYRPQRCLVLDRHGIGMPRVGIIGQAPESPWLQRHPFHRRRIEQEAELPRRQRGHPPGAMEQHRAEVARDDQIPLQHVAAGGFLRNLGLLRDVRLLLG